MPKDVILTPEGLSKLQDELDLLSTAKRREVAERIKEAREFGDIAENAQDEGAQNEQAMLESRIATLQEKLRMASVIDSKEISTDVVGVGSVVHVKDEKTGKSVKYTIVGSAEADPEQAKLCNESRVPGVRADRRGPLRLRAAGGGPGDRRSPPRGRAYCGAARRRQGCLPRPRRQGRQDSVARSRRRARAGGLKAPA